MNLVSILSLCSAVFSFFMAGLVFFRSPKSITNRLFFILANTCGWQALVDYGYFQSRTASQADLWWKLDFAWPLIISALAYIIMAITENERYLKKWSVNLFILGPGVLFLILDKAFKQVSNPPKAVENGWAFGGFQKTLAADMTLFWQTAVWIVIAVLLIRYLKTVRETNRRKRARLVLFAMAVGATSMLWEGIEIGKALGINIMGTFSILLTVINGIFAYAIWKYDLFALTPVTVAENIVTAISDIMLLVNNDKEIESCNRAGVSLLGYSKKEFQNMPLRKLFEVNAPLPWCMKDEPSEAEMSLKYIDTRLKTRSGKGLPVSLSNSILRDANGRKIGYLLIARDIAERNRREQELKVYKNHLEDLVDKRTSELSRSLERLKLEAKGRAKAEEERVSLEKERESLEEQLFHAQKLESIGRLAGGVAHDFNNLLFVINAYSEEFVSTIDKEDPLFHDLKEIHQAAHRATSLTQQLLAFSRKQITSPAVIDPNTEVKELHKMLGRIIGENIEFNIVPGINVGEIKIDPAQLGQILINLAINARDAIDVSGTITVEVNQSTLSPEQCLSRDDVAPGSYVVITFSDNGVGMDEETLSHIFDPFFTTKGPGKGTGLGLSTIYGIVKQNGGFLEVDSAVGKGTTFKLYFPKYEPVSGSDKVALKFVAPKGQETILLVEDDTQVRRLASRLLKQLGYTVHEASGAAEAATIFHEHKNEIDLLFTDVIMPGMDGKRLSHLLTMGHPNLKVLFMSGYNQEIASGTGKLDDDVNFIAKPFSSGDLSVKIRQVLDA